MKRLAPTNSLAFEIVDPFLTFPTKTNRMS